MEVVKGGGGGVGLHVKGWVVLCADGTGVCLLDVGTQMVKGLTEKPHFSERDVQVGEFHCCIAGGKAGVRTADGAAGFAVGGLLSGSHVCGSLADG
jgi:hypothetical protein